MHVQVHNLIIFEDFFPVYRCRMSEYDLLQHIWAELFWCLTSVSVWGLGLPVLCPANVPAMLNEFLPRDAL